MNPPSLDLSSLFRAAEAALILKQEELNAADLYNQNHGDHMVAIFQAAAQAAAAPGASGRPEAGLAEAGLAEAMAYAADLLRAQPQNGSAQVYARGLTELAAQFSQRGLTLEDLAGAAQRRLQKELTGIEPPEGEIGKSAETLKALLHALAGWEKAEVRTAAQGSGEGSPAEGIAKGALDMGYLFGVGLAYLQAKQKGGEPLDILVDTVVSSSPLAQVPHRARSGKIALRALLEAMSR